MTAELSVVIATYNRAGPLRTCLDGLAGQTADAGAFEVVVVVDGSTDGTRELLAGFRSPYPLRVICQENAGQGRARNRGIAAATGRFCLLLDDDVVASRDLVAEHLRAQRDGGGVLGVGRLEIDISPDAGWYAREVRKAWVRHYADLDAGRASVRIADCYSGNLCFPREAFLAVGGFAEDLQRGEDIELAIRLAGSSLPLVYLSGAAAVHYETKTSRGLLRDVERAGASCVEIYRRHPAALAVVSLDSFLDGGPLEIGLRRLLLAIHFPLAPLGAVGAALGRSHRGSRWAGLVRRFAFWRGVRGALADEQVWQALTTGVPILLYHALATPGERPSRFVVSAREFEWQMRWLARRGYRVVSLDDYLRCRREHRLPPPRSVVITFDDGYADNATLAAPILARHGFPATIFLVTDLVGRRNEWDAEGALAGRALLDWDTVRALERGSIRFGPHGRSHRGLTGLPAADLDEEIRGAWAALEECLEHAVPAFAFPFGEFDDAARRAVTRAGLQAACTVKRGRNSLAVPLDALRRVVVRGDRGRLAFRLAVWRGDGRLPGQD